MKKNKPTKEVINIPVKELKELTGMSTAFVSHIKTGRSKLPIKYCISISNRFSIPLHNLRPDVYPDYSKQ